MNLNEQNVFDYLSASIASINTSRIPRFLTKIVNQIPVKDYKESINQNKKFWKKYNSLNLSGRKSRIPVFQRNRSEVTQHREQNDFTINKLFVNNLNKLTNFEFNENTGKIDVRTAVGRTSTLNDWTQSQSQQIDCLKFILEILRSDLSADNKFRAIKRYRDKRLGMDDKHYSDNTCDDRVREWVDSGYITNPTCVEQQEEVLINNGTKSDSKVETINSNKKSKNLWTRRRAMDLIALNNKYSSFNSDISMSSVSSIDSLLESRREDPEELLIALGFGYVPEEQQSLNRIPLRFLESPSSAKGVNTETFTKSRGLVDFSSLSSSASFSPTDIRERSYSCGKIERYKKRLNSKESALKLDLPEIITSSCSSLLQSPPQTESILNPANRRFLESQGKQDKQNQLSSKRLIIGTKSYKLDSDGDPLAFPKTPSPGSTTPTPQTIDEQNNNIDYSSDSSKPPQIQRQNCLSEQDLTFGESNIRSTMTDMSSELSSSTTTLVGTVITALNEISNNEANDIFETSSEDKRNAFSQTDHLNESECNKTIESALVVAIQSLRLSLEFYKHQSLKLGNISTQIYSESTSDFTEEDLMNISKINELRDSIHKELVDMDIVLSRHLNVFQSSNILEVSFVSQAQLFTEAVKRIKQVLKEQQTLYVRLGLIKADIR